MKIMPVTHGHSRRNFFAVYLFGPAASKVIVDVLALDRSDSKHVGMVSIAAVMKIARFPNK
jgi:hypothetical protein